MPHTASTATARHRPCSWHGPGGTCGTTPTRLYMTGPRCAAHTPAALAGLPEPGTGRYCPPALCWCGTCPPRHPGPPDHPVPPTVSPAKPAAGLSGALQFAALGWHVFPLSAASKRPLANCPACRDTPARPAHRIEDCPCLPAGRWCHGVRAAITSPATITAWWRGEPAAVPGIAAGPSGLVLIDIDTHDSQLPADLATGLLPGINLAREPIPPAAWSDPGRFRDGRDTLRLLAAIRGGSQPWPADPAHQPVTVTTPSGGRHLWYQAPAPGLHQALSGPRGLAWQVDIKAGWSYGLAPGTTTPTGAYEILSGDTAKPGQMPGWLADAVIRVAGPRPPRPTPAPAPRPHPPDRQAAAYLAAVIDRGAARITTMNDGRQRALSALAYQAGGLLDWSGLPRDHVAGQLADAGTASGLRPALARRIVTRALDRGLSQPITPPRTPYKEA
jgi:hypothetical protein